MTVSRFWLLWGGPCSTPLQFARYLRGFRAPRNRHPSLCPLFAMVSEGPKSTPLLLPTICDGFGRPEISTPHFARSLLWFQGGRNQHPSFCVLFAMVSEGPKLAPLILPAICDGFGRPEISTPHFARSLLWFQGGRNQQPSFCPPSWETTWSI